MDSLVSSFVLLVVMRPAPSTIVSFFDLFQIKGLSYIAFAFCHSIQTVSDIQHEHWSYRSHQIIKRRQYISISVTHDDDLFFHWAPVVANLHKTDGRLTNTLKLYVASSSLYLSFNQTSRECRYPEARITFAIMEHESIAGLQRSEPKVLSIRSLSADELCKFAEIDDSLRSSKNRQLLWMARSNFSAQAPATASPPPRST